MTFLPPDMAQTPRTIRSLALLAALLPAFAAPPSAKASDPAVDMWLTQRSQFQQLIANQKPLGKTHVDDVFRIRVEKKFLVLRTPLVNSGGEQFRRASLDGIHGTALVSVARDDHASGLVEPVRFNLSLMDFPAPKEIVTISVTSNAQPNQLTISETAQTTNGPFHQIIFSQLRGAQTGGTGMVQLMVTDSRVQGMAPQQLNYEASDFFSFVQQYPKETAQYVRPMLRKLGQESLFAPDAVVGWQVFSDLWKADPSVVRRVNELLPGLDSDDYRVRDATLNKLQQFGRDGAAVLMHLDRTHLTPEQNARIDRALLPYAQLAATEAAKLRSNPEFLLDCLYSDDAGLRSAAIDRLRQIVRPDLPFDVNASPETRDQAVTALRAQFSSAHP